MLERAYYESLLECNPVRQTDAAHRGGDVVQSAENLYLNLKIIIIPKQQNQRNKTPLMKRINSSRHAVPIVVEGTLCTTRSTFCATGSVSPTTGLLLGETGRYPPTPLHQPTPSISAPHVILFLSLLLPRQKTLASYLR